jgi:hypothetical protein
MSFKLFIYYCAVCGGWAALVGWLLGRALLAPLPENTSAVGKAMLLGLSLGFMVALALGSVDILWNTGGRRMSQALLKGAVIAAIGCLGGLLGAALGQELVSLTGFEILFPLGWVLTGALIGASVGLYDLVMQEGGAVSAGARRKLLNGLLGGLLGGLAGSILYGTMGFILPRLAALVTRRPADELTSTVAWGFVAVGLCIGLFIGLAQVILKEAWLKVEQGFRAGRELLLTKDEITIGRAEGCDVGLFGDNTVERTHARIQLKNQRYTLADAGTPGGTFLNDQPVKQPMALRDGDRIRVGKSVLRFGERQKKKTASPRAPS